MIISNLDPQNAREEFLTYALSIDALKLDPEGYKLKSGRHSPHFFNSGAFHSGTALGELAHAYVVAAEHFEYSLAFGPAYKGIPLAVSFVRKHDELRLGNMKFAFNRKEIKDHAEGGQIVGAPVTGEHVLLLDDVITTGSSLSEARDIVVAHGGITVGVVIGFDRQECPDGSTQTAVQAFAEKLGLPVRSSANLDDLISLLGRSVKHTADPAVADILRKILTYKKQYGAQ